MAVKIQSSIGKYEADMNDQDRWQQLGQKRLTRRNLLRASARAGVGAAGLALVGCGDDDDDDETVAPAPAAPAPAAPAPAEPDLPNKITVFTQALVNNAAVSPKTPIRRRTISFLL